MLRSISQRFNVGVEKYLPDAFIFAIILTFITYIMGIVLAGQTPLAMIEHWYSGFWNFLAFTTQMLMILVTGYCLVEAPVVKKIVNRLASLPKTQGSALSLTMLVAGIGGYISWGLGFILGTLFAMEVARNVQKADYRILIAAAYTATIAILPASITVTAPLLVNTPGHSLEESIGLISLNQTIFGPMLLFVALVSFVLVIWAFRAMMPKENEVIPFRHSGEIAASTEAPVREVSTTLAGKLENSRVINTILVVMGFTWIIMYFYKNGFNLELNILNFIFLFLGLALHGSPISYIRSITKAMPSASGISLQFPFYAGIMGMMAGSGLIAIIANWFVSISNEHTFPLFSLISACIVNIFVPSAGGQWQIQGPVMVEAAKALNLTPAIAVNTVTIGDLVTNLLQPFFVLPALGLSGLSLKDIWGYCMVAMFIIFFVAAIGVTFLPVSF